MGELQERITEKIQLTNPPVLLLGWIQKIIEEMKTEYLSLEGRDNMGLHLGYLREKWFVKWLM